MVSRLLKRIPRLFLNSTIGILLTMLVLQDGFLHINHNKNNLDGNRIACVTNAFSLPQQRLAISQKQTTLRQQQRQQHHPETAIVVKSTTRIRLSAAIPFYATDVSDSKDNAKKNEANPSPPFLIESISNTPRKGEAVYKDIANLCIDVFFKELLDPSGKGNVNLVKTWQINYLKNLQAADLERRRNRCPDTNEMFLAYEVRKTRGTSEALSQPLLMDDELERAYNFKQSSTTNSNSNNNINNDKDGQTSSMDTASTCYVRGDLLGFVEVTQRSYGLGNAGNADSASSSSSSSSSASSSTSTPLFGTEFQKRPVLTNLAVGLDSRKYGIGSKLLDRCEEHVTEQWKMKEMILEVEDYNGKGLEFYQKRGYQVLFSDPASRRYDIQGFWLNKVRCRRDIMRKSLDRTPGTKILQSADSLFRKFKDSVGSF